MCWPFPGWGHHGETSRENSENICDVPDGHMHGTLVLAPSDSVFDLMDELVDESGVWDGDKPGRPVHPVSLLVD